MIRFFRTTALTAAGVALAAVSYAGDASMPAQDTDFTIDVNTVLTACAILLLVVIGVLGSTLRSAILFYHKKREQASKDLNSSGKIATVLLAILMVFTFPSFASDATTESGAGSSSILDEDVIRWILYTVLSIEIVVVFLFAKLISFFTGVESFRKSEEKKKWISFDFSKFWTKINSLKPLEEEASLDAGHNYDGIRELNNVTPPWFIAGFVISILFAITYMWRYHVARSAPLQIEEYNIAVAESKIRLDEYLKTQANNVDENTVVVLNAEGIAAGQALFATNCVACHGGKGEGASVGPNLSDNYWLHKGGIKDIFKSIKYGWQEKGMKSWKDDFSPTQIAQLASFVHSLKGSNPAGAKEAQGDLFAENPIASADTTSKL